MLCERIRKARKDANLTQEDLANKIGVKRAVISKYESGKIEPSVSQLKKIAAVLDISVSRLIGDDKALTPDVYRVFLTRLFGELSTHDAADIEAATGSAHPYDDLERQQTISLARARETADELGVTLDYLMGLTDDSNTIVRSIPNQQIRFFLDDADTELLETVHMLCGMDADKIAEEYATGSLQKTWDPAKIYLVCEYLKDSRTILEKMFATAGMN